MVFVPGGGYAQPSSLFGKRDSLPVYCVEALMMLVSAFKLRGNLDKEDEVEGIRLEACQLSSTREGKYSASMLPSLAQCVLDTTNGRLQFENMIMYKLGSFSLMAMLISPQSRKRKMAAGRGSCESALEELSRKLLCLTGGTHGLLAWAWREGDGGLQQDIWPCKECACCPRPRHTVGVEG
nr:hypothetical protein CFP56_18083 [Quercus suber]